MVNTEDGDINEGVLNLINDIHYGDVSGTHNIVVATILVLKDIINNAEWTTAENLINIISKNGKYLVEAIPLEFSIGNMVRRILQIIREEYTSELKNNTDETDTQESLHKILTAEVQKILHSKLLNTFILTKLL
ncbi:translation initiation factor eIF2B subunit beta-like [Bombus flavifrons]|uniref:translation initiation factor eIF2B subunit beta-like n=1 Tax=Bombus flavifrons TaxID=103934 RepID=UPI003704690D